MDAYDIEHRFKFHAASRAEKANEHSSVREACHRAAILINSLGPDGREKSLAITSLEEAMFWGNAMIARNLTAADEPQEA